MALRASSRGCPLPQVQRQLEARAVPVGAGAPAKQATRWMAPALPVFAGMPAPTKLVQASRSWARRCSCVSLYVNVTICHLLPQPDDGQGFLPHTAENSQARSPPPCGVQPE
ncbi:hypothetical protein E5221_16040 [Pseudomonas sp. A2]|nr:hypothetical protein E5221_16040 [Pseudomonas sp. A2]